MWKKIKDFPLNIVSKDTSSDIYVGDLIIKNMKYRRLNYIYKSYFINKGGLEDIILLIGQ
jgi:hypothetical protein